MTAEPIVIYRAIVTKGLTKPFQTPFLFGPYRAVRGAAELDKIKFLGERKDLHVGVETFDIQIVPAIRLEDGRVAVVVPVGSSPA